MTDFFVSPVRASVIAVSLLMSFTLIPAVSAETLPIQKRLEVIITQMKTLRFCKSEGCSYKDIKYTLTANKKEKTTYTVRMTANIARLASVYDKARYDFKYTPALGWQLTGGDESTDINDTNYTGDHFTSNSIYNSTMSRGAVTDLFTGYKKLYFNVLNKGVERR